MMKKVFVVCDLKRHATYNPVIFSINKMPRVYISTAPLIEKLVHFSWSTDQVRFFNAVRD